MLLECNLIEFLFFLYYRGTLHVDVRLLSLGIDQCTQGSVWFANTHKCNKNSTQVMGVYH